MFWSALRVKSIGFIRPWYGLDGDLEPFLVVWVLSLIESLLARSPWVWVDSPVLITNGSSNWDLLTYAALRWFLLIDTALEMFNVL